MEGHVACVDLVTVNGEGWLGLGLGSGSRLGSSSRCWVCGPSRR